MSEASSNNDPVETRAALLIAVAPAQQETVASYLTRLANLHGLPLRELWEPISLPRPKLRVSFTAMVLSWRARCVD